MSVAEASYCKQLLGHSKCDCSFPSSARVIIDHPRNVTIMSIILIIGIPVLLISIHLLEMLVNACACTTNVARGGPSIYQGEGPSTRGAPKGGVAYDALDTIVANNAFERALEAKLCSALLIVVIYDSFRDWG